MWHCQKECKQCSAAHMEQVFFNKYVYKKGKGKGWRKDFAVIIKQLNADQQEQQNRI